METQPTDSKPARQERLTACALFKRCVEMQRREDWQTFIERYRSRIDRTVAWALRRRGFLPIAEEPEEIAQELYCRLLGGVARQLHGVSDGELWSYLGQIAYRLLLDRQRWQLAAKRFPPFSHTVLGVEQVPSQSSSPEELTLVSERRRLLLHRCAAALREPCSGPRVRALWMAVFGGWNSRDIARRVGGGLSASQIDCMIHRLKKRLAAEGLYLPRRSPV